MTSTETRSPRTDAEPMAFTASEFARGALSAWGLFLGLATLVFVPLYTYLFWYPLIVVVPWSLGALVLGSPIAYALGRGLRRTRRTAVHALAFTALGVVIGVTTTALALVTPGSAVSLSGAGSGSGSGSGSGASYLPSILMPVIAVCTAAAAAVPLGWWIGAHRVIGSASGSTS